MKRKKGIVVLLLTAALLIWLMWDMVSIYLFPRLTLSGAVRRAAAGLWEEYSDSPLYKLSQLLGRDENYTMEIQLLQTRPVLGEVRYDLSAAVQNTPRRISLDGFLTLADRELDVSGYLDEKGAAVSSAMLLKDGWYGVCFDTIARDVRSNSVLSFLLGEDKLLKLEAYAVSVKSWTGRELPRIFSVGREDIQDLCMGILMLDLDIRPEVFAINGRKRLAFILSSAISGEEICAAAESGGGRIPTWAADFAQWMQQDEQSVLELEFIMADGRLYAFSVCTRAGNDQYSMEVLLDEADTVIVVRGQEKNHTFSICLGPEEESSEYTQRISLSTTDSEGTEALSCGFRWDASTGNLWLRLSNRIQTGYAHILLTQNRIRLEAAQLDPLLVILTGEGCGMEHCVLTLMPGAQVSKPEYLDFRDWSMEDLFILMEGLSAFMGIQTE